MKKEIGKRLEEIRKENGKTQQEVADLLKIPRTRYTNYENGVSSMPDELLDIFVKKFGTSYDFVKGLSPIMVKQPEAKYYTKRESILELVDQLPESPLKVQIKEKVIEMINQDLAQKEKIIALYELQDDMFDTLKKAGYSVAE